MLGKKIDAQNLLLKISARNLNALGLLKTLGQLSLPGVFLLTLPACFMTKAQGESLNLKMYKLEGEVAKLQRVRYDLEVLLDGKVGDLFARIAKLEVQLASFRESLYEGSNQSGAVAAELQNLRGELEQAKNQYKDLESDQKSLAQNQLALKAAQNKISIPPFAPDHFAMAKKYYTSGKLQNAVYLLEEFVKDYPKEKELLGQSYYLLGEIFKKQASEEKSTEEAEILAKKSVVNYQKIVEGYKASVLREESLFKMGQVLMSMGNKTAAAAAFSELLLQNKKSPRADEAKKHLASLE